MMNIFTKGLFIFFEIPGYLTAVNGQNLITDKQTTICNPVNLSYRGSVEVEIKMAFIKLSFMNRSAKCFNLLMIHSYHTCQIL